MNEPTTRAVALPLPSRNGWVPRNLRRAGSFIQ